MSTKPRVRNVRAKYEFIKAQQRDFRTQLMCIVLGVAPSGYYEWLLPSGRLALLTYDATMTSKGGHFESDFYVTVVDVAARLLSPEPRVPVSPNTVMSSFGIQGNALVVLELDDDGVNDAVTTIRRFTIDDKACKWRRLD